jgi:hypothetical protein
MDGLLSGQGSYVSYYVPLGSLVVRAAMLWVCYCVTVGCLVDRQLCCGFVTVYRWFV